MTTIVGYRPSGSDDTWMAADSRVSGGSFIYPSDGHKLQRCGPWLIGSCGSVRMDEYFSEDRDWPTAATLRDGFFGWLKEIGLEPIEDKGAAPAYKFSLLAARRGEFVEIASTGAIVRPRGLWGFLAIGSGSEYAYGAASVASHLGMSPLDVVRRAVEAAIIFDAHSGAPVWVKSTCEGE